MSFNNEYFGTKLSVVSFYLGILSICITKRFFYYMGLG